VIDKRASELERERLREPRPEDLSQNPEPRGGMMNEPINHIVIEDDVRELPVTRRFLERYPGAEIIGCGSPADRASLVARAHSPKRTLYLGRRRGPYLKPFPQHPWYGASGGCETNLILGYNCGASCRYCFVQTIFDDPVPTIFVGDTEMIAQLESYLKHTPDARISTGEYIDSLLFDDITGYTQKLMTVFEPFPSSTLELRTKSQLIDHLPADPIPQVLVSYSINPSDVVTVAEPGTPRLERRLAKARELHDRGYRIALRVDPVIPAAEFVPGYRELPSVVERCLGWRRVSKVFLGALRFDNTLLVRMTQTAGGRRLLDAEFVPCPDGYLRPSRYARIEAYRLLSLGIRRWASRIDISITMEPDYVIRAVFEEG